MEKKKFINRLCRNILSGRFDWERYLSPKYYFSTKISTMPLHTSYGIIGFVINFPFPDYSNISNITYDWEFKKLKINEMDWQEWLNKAE